MEDSLTVIDGKTEKKYEILNSADPVKALQIPTILFESNDQGTQSNDSQKRKRSSLACVRCRRRHTKCPGGEPCKKCIKAKQPCEYVEADRKIVISMKYLNKLQDDISRLKIENANLRSNLKKNNSNANDKSIDFNGNLQSLNSSSSSLPNNKVEPVIPTAMRPLADKFKDIPIPFLDKYGKLINSRTGESIYVGSSSMTLFGLEINNLLPRTRQQTDTSSPEDKSFESTILEREGNAYRIRVGQTKLSPGIAVNFTLPSYSYALLLVDTFISYNDGCFYFFNEGLVKENLRRIYQGEKLHLINDVRDSKRTTVESIWFCQLLLIFAVGEIYLGTVNDSNGNKLNWNSGKHKLRQPILPGSEFFYQASELFTGLFPAGAITNCVMEGGIEVMLLFAFYLQVADCTIASYFYFGSALRACLMLGLHVDAAKENLRRPELEHRRRLFWTVFMFERMLASKAGLPLSLTDDYVSAELPDDFDTSMMPKSCEYFIFPEAEYIKNCVKITSINASILSELYSKQPSSNILPVVNNLVMQMLDWKNSLPEILQCDFSQPEVQISRWIVNMMTEYFQGMNLAVRPLLMHFTMQQLKATECNGNFVDLSSYSKQLLALLNCSFQASINTVRSEWTMMQDNMVALFGYMDREYLFTSLATLILFNCTFGVNEATYQHLDHALIIFTKMKNMGNHPALLRRAQLLKLMSMLDFNGEMRSLIDKHEEDVNLPTLNTDNMVSGSPEDKQNEQFDNKMPSFQHILNQTTGDNGNSPSGNDSFINSIRYNNNDNIDDKYKKPLYNRASPELREGTPLLAFTSQNFPLTPEVFNRYLETSSTELEMELWNDISSQAMWLSGDVGEELSNLLENISK